MTCIISPFPLNHTLNSITRFPTFRSSRRPAVNAEPFTIPLLAPTSNNTKMWQMRRTKYGLFHVMSQAILWIRCFPIQNFVRFFLNSFRKSIFIDALSPLIVQVTLFTPFPFTSHPTKLFPIDFFEFVAGSYWRTVILGNFNARQL